MNNVVTWKGNKDHSQLETDPDSGDGVVNPIEPPLVANQQQLPNFGRSCNFPNKLYDLLEYATTHDSTCGNLIAWSSNGLSFDIWNPQDFMIELGNKFFPQQASFRALERQLNNWGFVRTKLARRAFRFYHPLFQRDKPQLKRYIRRSTIHKPTPSAGASTCVSAKHIQSYYPSPPRAPLSGMGHGRRLTGNCMLRVLQGGNVHNFDDDDDDDDDTCNLLNCRFNTLHQETLGSFKYSKENYSYSKAHS